MYIIEKLLKKIFPKRLSDECDYNPLNYIEDDDADCSHEFMPVDSTGEILACIKCGFIVKRNDNIK